MVDVPEMIRIVFVALFLISFCAEASLEKKLTLLMDPSALGDARLKVMAASLLSSPSLSPADRENYARIAGEDGKSLYAELLHFEPSDDFETLLQEAELESQKLAQALTPPSIDLIAAERSVNNLLAIVLLAEPSMSNWDNIKIKGLTGFYNTAAILTASAGPFCFFTACGSVGGGVVSGVLTLFAARKQIHRSTMSFFIENTAIWAHEKTLPLINAIHAELALAFAESGYQSCEPALLVRVASENTDPDEHSPEHRLSRRR